MQGDVLEDVESRSAKSVLLKLDKRGTHGAWIVTQETSIPDLGLLVIFGFSAFVIGVE